MAICAICMCANGTIVMNISVGSVYLSIWRCRKYHIANSKLIVQFNLVRMTDCVILVDTFIKLAYSVYIFFMVWNILTVWLEI